VPVNVIEAGDHLLIRAGEIVPVDGTVETKAALDESALTGEPLPSLAATETMSPAVF
jgi:cation transport ATPase